MANYNFAVSPWDFLGANWQRMPAGMRNNNPGNIKYVGQSSALGPSSNTDQGDPQAVFASPQAGIEAMRQLLARKYAGGKTTPMEMIAGQGGWTPGNSQAAANVARYAGISPTSDINFNDPSSANRFMSALMMQEHGPASKAYASLLGGAPVPAPSPYAGMADGPKGQESYPGLGPSQETTAGILGSPQGGMTAQQGNDISSLLNPQQQTFGTRLQTAFQRLGQIPDARPAPMMPWGDARNSGNDLLKALQANGLNLAGLLAKQRIG